MRSTHRFPFLVAAAAALLPLIVFAADVEKRAARLVTTARAIEWHPASGAAAAVLSVQRPDGEVITETFAAGRNPMLRLDGLADGMYSYELRVAQADAAPLVQSGSFTVANGVVVSPDTVETSATTRPLRPVGNPFYADDVSAQGGVCAGSDCTNAESYGLASAKLKENNTRLKFEDTSVAPFATTDWQLSANDTFSGGANKFFVEDLTAATVPLLIEGGTPNNTLYLDSAGRIGIRTTTPARDLTIANPNSTGIRMELSASPFQTWEIVANATNFFVRDVNHEQNPFIIKTSAPYNSLVVDATGRIGLGVAAPLYQIDHSSGARLDAGNWINASSRGLKQDIHQLDGDAAFDALNALEPVTFAYKANPRETHVGFIAEDVPDLVGTSDRRGLSSMDVVAVLTKVIQEQQRTIENLET
ncbi:MAG TPA: tail fiber domain-containing protein, partial [Thermoanaerobaculia bacterium]|nr:tail fiber domain-containing protein [Thermoanaerobaculia bacterium]